MGETSGVYKKGLTGNALKMIAIVTMLIDHMGAVLIEGGYYGFPEQAIAAQELSGLYLADVIMRLVGRIAFPIFCFLLVEGFCHTRNVKKYAGRLLLFAFLSELPFDFAIFGTPFYFGYQNVYFTLFIGIAVLYGYEHFKGNILGQIGAVVTGCLVAVLLKTDYDVMGVVMIFILYQLRDRKTYQIICGGLLAAIESLGYFGVAALAFVPIGMYNGERGKSNMKYFFYVFYPMHLLILGVVRMALFG